MHVQLKLMKWLTYVRPLQIRLRPFKQYEVLGQSFGPARKDSSFHSAIENVPRFLIRDDVGDTGCFATHIFKEVPAIIPNVTLAYY